MEYNRCLSVIPVVFFYVGFVVVVLFYAFVPVHIWICVLAKMEILELVRFVLSLLMCFFVYYIYIYSDGILRPGSYRIFPVIRKTTRSTQKHIKMCVD